jgi:hypothetical protein
MEKYIQILLHTFKKNLQVNDHSKNVHLLSYIKTVIKYGTLHMAQTVKNIL